MMKFSIEPELRWHADIEEWEVLTPFTAIWLPTQSEFRAILVTIPAGFFTDLASLPGIVRSVNPVNGKHLQSAILHDYLYRKSFIKVTKAEADEMFYDGMIARNTATYRAKYMWQGVRAFGGSSFVNRS